MRKFGKIALGFIVVLTVGYATGASIQASNSQVQADEKPSRTVEYKGEPVKVYFGNPEKETSVEVSEWGNGLSKEMISDVLSQMEKATGLPLAEIEKKNK